MSHHIPDPVDDLFIPELENHIEKLKTDATHEDVVEMVNDIIEVMNHIIEILSGGGEVEDKKR